MKATRFKYFDLNFKVIVTNMSTQITYESDHISYSLIQLYQVH